MGVVRTRRTAGENRGGTARMIGAALVAVLACAWVMAATPAAAATDGVYTFTVDATTGDATITGYTGTDTSISIPETVRDGGTDHTVTTIGNNAFYAKGLTSVVIPDTVTTIGYSAFESNDIASLNLGDTVTSIGDAAFDDNELTALTIPGSVTTIDGYAFADNHLTSVTIPGSVTSIGIFAFDRNDLTSVTIPGSVTVIDRGVFANNHLTSVTIPGSVTSIGSRAFGYTPDLSRVLMAGDAPTVTPVGTTVSGGLGIVLINDTFDTSSGHLVVYYRDGATGYGSGTTWRGYTAKAVKLSAQTDVSSYAAGDQVTITGSGVVPGAAVLATIGNATIGTATADDTGKFTMTGALPATMTSGRHQITVTSPFPGADLTASLDITVPMLPTVTTQPHNVTTAAGTDATFTAAATGYPRPSVRWQVSTDHGATWADLTDGRNASGTTTDTVTVTDPAIGDTGTQYRAVFTNAAGQVLTEEAELTVTEPTTAGTSARATGASSDGRSPSPAAAGTTNGPSIALANTGTPATEMLGIGTLLTVAGGLLLGAAGRRRAHRSH